jgi:hypothetical protein
MFMAGNNSKVAPMDFNNLSNFENMFKGEDKQEVEVSIGFEPVAIQN